MRALVFFLYLRGAASFDALARFFLLAIGRPRLRSERLFVAVDRVGGAAATGGRRGAGATAATVGGGARGLLDLRLGPAQARAELVGDDLDDGALLAVLGLPRALLEAAEHDDAGALGDAGRGVLAERAPGDDVEERRLLLPLAVDLVAAVDGEAEAGDAAAAAGVAQLGVAGDVADER